MHRMTSSRIALWGRRLTCCFACATLPAAIPIQASAATGVVAPIAYGKGIVSVARTGIAAATIAELADAPPLLAERGTQAFLDDAFAHLETLAVDRTLRVRLGALRERFRMRDAHFDRARTLPAYQSATGALLRALAPPRDRLFLLGTVAQQTEYNARVLRERDADAQLRAAVGTLDAADGRTGGLASLRAQLAALPAEHWSECSGLAHRIVMALLASSDDVFPSAPRIWTILVRSRSVAGRDAAHLALDVVWFDGHHDTYAAYPDGNAFDRDASHMTCARDREPATGFLRSTPLTPPGSSYDAVATVFEAACAAFTAKAPEYRVAENSDDRFIAAMLAAAGIDPNVVRGH